jgi:beta-glucuronidase
MISRGIIFVTICFIILTRFSDYNSVTAQSAMINVSARRCLSLNGKWQVIIDPTGVGEWREVWKERKPEKKTDFIEYSFEGGPVLNVPGDFNTQLPELTYYEGTIWYKKVFKYLKKQDKRLFLHFGAVNYLANVYLNGNLVGSHEGGFTPFQFEISNLVKDGENTIIVKVNNQRQKDGIPDLGYDWFNYGGINRDVNLIETPASFIEDYSIQLKKNSSTNIVGWVKIDGANSVQKVEVDIPELKMKLKTQTNNEGVAEINIKSKVELWNPEKPKLYRVVIQSETDTIDDEIGFRTIEVKGPQILLNGKPIFLKGVNIHEEMPLRAAKAYSKTDAFILLNWAKELGCNFVRLAHYPHNEYMIKLAEEMGFLVWEEIPVYQHIEFSTPGVEQKMDLMLKEMIKRDKNRCNIIIWSLANETYSSTPNRDNALIKLEKKCKQLDSTRLTTTPICTQGYENNTFNVWDTLYRHFDLISINEYLGWYTPWQGSPKDSKWKMVCIDKPVIISEFGGEALYGNIFEPTDEANNWTEGYQENIYKDQVELFKTILNLSGVCPWVLVDFRSLSRMQQVYQKGWNRKGLLSDMGNKKKAWYIMKKYYNDMKIEY